MELSENQAALILEADSVSGEIDVNVASGDPDGLAAALCSIIAEKLIGDEEFQQELMELLESEGE